MKLSSHRALIASFQRLIGQTIHAFGPGSKGCWGKHPTALAFIIKDISYEDDSLAIFLDCHEGGRPDARVAYHADQHGLIYTCQVFEKELREMIARVGIKADLGYSEQGMQGDDYVHFDFFLL